MMLTPEHRRALLHAAKTALTAVHASLNKKRRTCAECGLSVAEAWDEAKMAAEVEAMLRKLERWHEELL